MLFINMEENVLKIIKEEIDLFFAKDNFHIDNITESFIKGDITEEEFLNQSLDEGVLKNAAIAVFNKLMGMLKSAFSNVKTVGKKSIAIAKSIWSLVSKFCDKLGNLCKVVIVLIVIFLVTSANSYAATTGDHQTPQVIYDAAIGFLEQNSELFKSDFGTVDFMQAKTILYGIRDQAGEITSMDDTDMYKVSEKSQMLAKHALKFMEKMAKEAQDSEGKVDSKKMKAFYELVQIGKQWILKSSNI